MTASAVSYTTWLEGIGGGPIPVQGNCSLGRSSKNQVVLEDPKVSRRHAMIHTQGNGECWLVDFGSANGTSINGRRVVQPTALRDQDRIYIADHCLVFRKSGEVLAAHSAATGAGTVREIKTLHCWLLVTDIEGSTQLSQTHSPEELPVLIGGWFSRCKQIVDSHSGQINKFLGDGFFAYWVEEAGTVGHVTGAMEELRRAQEGGHPRFRWVLHYGAVSVGGETSMGEASLLGREVNFVFRMEKLAGKLGLPRLLSDAARQALRSRDDMKEAGSHTLSGFDGNHSFHTI